MISIDLKLISLEQALNFIVKLGFPLFIGILILIVSCFFELLENSLKLV
tara:strand:+ start:997 stop:1143 length:147 start_codon:yes stop_codon:yes gene_type:complete